MDDKEIITLYWQRSQIAIIETKSKYGHYCRAIASNILSNYADIEECENDTYMTAWNIIPPNRPNKLSVFLGRVIRNIALDKYSYNKAKKRNNEFDVILSELEECLSSPDTVENQYEHGELARSISKFLYTIDREARSVFIVIIDIINSKISPELVGTARGVYGAQKGVNVPMRIDNENYCSINSVEWITNDRLSFNSMLTYNNAETVENVTVDYEFSNKSISIQINN